MIHNNKRFWYSIQQQQQRHVSVPPSSNHRQQQYSCCFHQIVRLSLSLSCNHQWMFRTIIVVLLFASQYCNVFTNAWTTMMINTPLWRRCRSSGSNLPQHQFLLRQYDYTITTNNGRSIRKSLRTRTKSLRLLLSHETSFLPINKLSRTVQSYHYSNRYSNVGFVSGTNYLSHSSLSYIRELSNFSQRRRTLVSKAASNAVNYNDSYEPQQLTTTNSTTTSLIGEEDDDDDEDRDHDNDYYDESYDQGSSNIQQSNNDTTNIFSKYTTTYHAPVMWKECISSLLQCQRGRPRIRIPIQQPTAPTTTISNGDIDPSTMDADIEQTLLQDGRTYRNQNQLNRERNKLKKLFKKQSKQIQQNPMDVTATSSSIIQPLVPVSENPNEFHNVIYIDGTVGGGGHSKALLEVLQPGDIVFGCDVDTDALRTTQHRLQEYSVPASNSGDNVLSNLQTPIFIPVQSNFCDLSISKLLRAAQNAGGIELQQYVADRLSVSSNPDTAQTTYNFGGVDGILLDLGVSSYQIDTAERGFAHRFDGPLDMRLGGNSSSIQLTAADLCNEFDEYQLQRIFQWYGDEPRALKIARSIIQHRPIVTTMDLTNAVAAVVPDFAKRGRRYGRIATLSRIFQSLRIFVNQEDSVLQTTLERTVPHLLRTGGRLVVLSYHSLEDRMMKQILRDGYIKNTIRSGTTAFRNPSFELLDSNDPHQQQLQLQQRQQKHYLQPIGKKQKATEEEIQYNNRARSATLRVGERQ